MEPCKFTIKDEDGKPHKYEVNMHPARKGSLLRARIAAMVAEPLAAVVYEVVKLGDIRAAVAIMAASIATDEQMGDPGKRAEIDRKRAEILALVDPAKLAGAVKNALLSMPESLIFDLFEYVTRDGIPLYAMPDQFDSAYAANYSELEAALWEVVSINRFLSLPATLSAKLGG